MTAKSSDCLSSSSSNPITTQTFVWVSALAMEMLRDKAWITAGVHLPVNFMLCGFQAQFINCQLTCEVLALVLKWTLPPPPFFFVLTGENSLANYTPVHFLSKCTGRFIRELETALPVPLAASARTFARQFNFLSSFNPAPFPPIVSLWMRKDGLLIILAKGWEIQHFFSSACSISHQSAFPKYSESHRVINIQPCDMGKLVLSLWKPDKCECMELGFAFSGLLMGVTQTWTWPKCFMKDAACNKAWKKYMHVLSITKQGVTVTLSWAGA